MAKEKIKDLVTSILETNQINEIREEKPEYIDILMTDAGARSRLKKDDLLLISITKNNPNNQTNGDEIVEKSVTTFNKPVNKTIRNGISDLMKQNKKKDRVKAHRLTNTVNGKLEKTLIWDLSNNIIVDINQYSYKEDGMKLTKFNTKEEKLSSPVECLMRVFQEVEMQSNLYRKTNQEYQDLMEKEIKIPLKNYRRNNTYQSVAIQKKKKMESFAVQIC